jgi:hypothetical protein
MNCGPSRRGLKERARLKTTGKSFFISEQRTPLHHSTVNLALQKYSDAAGLSVRAHPHMLRHACGSGRRASKDFGGKTRIRNKSSVNCCVHPHVPAASAILCVPSFQPIPESAVGNYRNRAATLPGRRTEQRIGPAGDHGRQSGRPFPGPRGNELDGAQIRKRQRLVYIAR